MISLSLSLFPAPPPKRGNSLALNFLAIRRVSWFLLSAPPTASLWVCEFHTEAGVSTQPSLCKED